MFCFLWVKIFLGHLGFAISEYFYESKKASYGSEILIEIFLKCICGY